MISSREGKYTLMGSCEGSAGASLPPGVEGCVRNFQQDI